MCRYSSYYAASAIPCHMNGLMRYCVGLATTTPLTLHGCPRCPGLPLRLRRRLRVVMAPPRPRAVCPSPRPQRSPFHPSPHPVQPRCSTSSMLSHRKTKPWQLLCGSPKQVRLPHGPLYWADDPYGQLRHRPKPRWARKRRAWRSCARTIGL